MAGLIALEIVGALTTVRVAVLLPAPATGLWVVATPEVVLLLAPTMLLVTLNVTVQLLPAGIVIPEKLSAVWPPVKVVPAAHDPPTTPPTALMFASMSVNAEPVRANALPFDNVKVTVELPPD